MYMLTVALTLETQAEAQRGELLGLRGKQIFLQICSELCFKSMPGKEKQIPGWSNTRAKRPTNIKYTLTTEETM